MEGRKTEEKVDNVLLRSWIIYCNSSEQIYRVQKEIDSIFSDYSFYPEVDWAKYRYRPPENYQVLGAWRHPQTKLFAFLLDNPFGSHAKLKNQVMLYVAGTSYEIKNISERIYKLKAKYSMKEKKDRETLILEERFKKIKPGSLVLISAILGVLTAIINAFSLYLRKLPPPEFENKITLILYKALLIVVHFSSLILLLLVILIVIFFLLKYGRLLIKRI